MMRRLSVFSLVLIVSLAFPLLMAQNPASYEVASDWVELRAGMEWGPVSSVSVDGRGRILAMQRVDPAIVVLDAAGKFVKGWADGLFKWAHGLRVDDDGLIWATDGQGHVVMKFSPDGELLLRLGQRDVAGDGPDTFNRPTDVAVARNGDFFVSDGYGNSRVVKFDRDGRFLKSWGSKGTGPGEFDLPHSIVIDSRGRVLVGDRENSRVQIFDQEGNYLDQWSDVGAPYGLYITEEDILLVADANRGSITIVDARNGQKLDVINGLGRPHWVSMDARGNIYFADVRGQNLGKLVPKK